jgi:hypothetical protein
MAGKIKFCFTQGQVRPYRAAGITAGRRGIELPRGSNFDFLS